MKKIKLKCITTTTLIWVVVTCLCWIGPVVGQQDEDLVTDYEGQVNVDILNRLNKIATDYERMMNRNGKFLFWQRFYQQPYERPIVEYSKICL